MQPWSFVNSFIHFLYELPHSKSLISPKWILNTYILSMIPFNTSCVIDFSCLVPPLWYAASGLLFASTCLVFLVDLIPGEHREGRNRMMLVLIYLHLSLFLRYLLNRGCPKIAVKFADISLTNSFELQFLDKFAEGPHFSIRWWRPAWDCGFQKCLAWACFACSKWTWDSSCTSRRWILVSSEFWFHFFFLLLFCLNAYQIPVKLLPSFERHCFLCM